MVLLGIDLGATKLASAIFSEDGELLFKEHLKLGNREGTAVGKFITDTIKRLIKSADLQGNKIRSIGISVPGISNMRSGTV
jgi:glucokinase